VEENRYMRHRPLLSNSAWQRLCETPMLVAGVGGLGSHVLESLSRLGPLTLELWDPGELNTPDLNRQILYAEADLGRPKVEAAAERLSAINRELTLRPMHGALSAARFDAESSLAGGPFVLFDCLDSFAARGELEKIRQARKCPVFHGGVDGWFGQATTFLGSGAGYEGAFGPEFASIPAGPKPILPQTVAATAGFQVSEYLHWCENPEKTPLSSAMLMYDGESMRVDRVELS
jgi:Dinucleotide-utilizing enzymes involved in molybdopterin and thiamine biosynthesis family 2